MKNLRLPGFVINSVLRTASSGAAVIAPLFIDRKRVERRKNIAYGTGVAQRLDVYLPKNRASGAKLPIALFIHGGGFRYFSKDSHAAAAARLAESGRIVFCIDYRLTPEHPFPAGLSDAYTAYAWVVANAEIYGGDLTKISLIGESAGAGFIASLCLYLFGIRSFPSSVKVPPIPAVKPKAAIAHCGYYEVSDIDRFRDDERCHPIAHFRIAQIRRNYLPDFERGRSPEWALADPCVVLSEMVANGTPLPKGFPEFFIPVGETDPVIGDSERLAAGLAKLGQPDRLRIYPGVGHAFYASPSGIQSKRCWEDIYAFLDRLNA